MLVRELGLDSLSSLKQLVEEEGYLPHVEPADVPLTQELQLRLCVELGERYPAEGCHFWPPNTISALMNWETICALLGRLPLHVRNRIAKFHPEKGTPMRGIAMAKAATAAPVTRPPIQPAPTSLAKAATASPATSKMDDVMETDAITVIDSHAHLDVLLGRRRCDTLTQFGSTQDLNQGGTLVFEGVVVNFVYPEHWERAARISGDSKVYCTYGVHPRRINPCSPVHLWIPRLERLSTTEKCVGVGEVGLDNTTSSPTEQASQRRFLTEVLDKVFRPSIHVLVLHYRDNGDGAPARDTLQILTKKGLTDARIHRHCFSGTQNELVEDQQSS